MNLDIETVDAKHIFIDIVNYTYNRSVEAQTFLIESLNRIVNESIKELKLKSESVIFIPTGDGMCISLINIAKPYDIHIQLSLLLLGKLNLYNKSQKDEMRQFSLRIGINENTDNLILDINKQKNISGAGISYASRIEGLADGNQILVGNQVFEKLVQREKYMDSFVSYDGEVKHGVSLKVHQYKNSQFDFLNNQTPTIFKPKAQKKKTLSEFEAHYMSVCLRNEEFFSNALAPGQSTYSLHVAVFHLTQDLFGKANATKTSPTYTTKVKHSFEEYFKYVQSVEFWIIADFKSLIATQYLNNITEYFKEPHLFVSAKGIKKLKEDHIKIYKAYALK